MVRELESNPWSAPFLHERFKEVVKFKLWNTTEQLDGVAEMEGWRDMRLFNSGGVKYGSEAVSCILFVKGRESGTDEGVDSRQNLKESK